MRRVKGISREALEFILEASRSSMPREFAGLLQAREGVISEILILPGTESSEWMAWVPLYMLPSMPIVGSCHSHPVPNPAPSQEDLEFFSRTGSYHIIAFPPFDERSWRCYDSSGRRRRDLIVMEE
ncbi:MAG: Mov34/MPN/PAD-1 family protein [Methanothrix sp.]